MKGQPPSLCIPFDPIHHRFSRASAGMGRRMATRQASTHPSAGPAGTGMKRIDGKKQDAEALLPAEIQGR